MKVIEGMSSAAKQRMASRILDDVREEQGVSKTGSVKLQTRGPHPKTITFGNIKVERKITKEELMRIKAGMNLSGNQLLKLRTCLRTVFGRKSVEDGAAEYLTDLNHRLEGYFKLVNLSVKKTHKGAESYEDRVGVFCSDFDGLIELLLGLRDIDPEKEEILLGFDDGQGFLKLMMLIQSSDDHTEPEKKRSKYQDGIMANSFKNTSVKKLMVLGCVENTQEHYENVKQILDQVDVTGVEGVTESLDIKMVLVEEGKQRASCTYNCIFGDGKAPYTCGCKLLTVGDLRRAYER